MYLPLKIMIIKSLDLHNYRNYGRACIQFDKGINILYGNNAQGKTNVLEAIYLGITSKSHRASGDKELIAFGEEESHVKLLLEREGVENRIDIHIKKNKSKGIAVNSLALRKASDLFGIANVVFFSPEDLSMIKNGPAERRRFMDVELCQLSKIYLHAFMEYNKVLHQRNKLLKEIHFRSDLADTLEVWDLQLIKYGKELIRQRQDFVDRLKEKLYAIHYTLTEKKEKLEIFYDKNISEEDFAGKLEKERENDFRNKSTSVGPHRDDIGFFIASEDNRDRPIDVRKFASQGQQRTVALSLKLAEIELVKDLIGDYPILLLDDVLSELDYARQTKLLSSIKHIQTIISCTGVEDFISTNVSVDKIFKIVKGEVIDDTN